MSEFSFDDPNWRQGPRIASNELWFNSSANAGAQVIRQSPQYSEFACSKAALDRLSAGLRDGKITHAYIVLAKRSESTVVCIKPLAEIVSALKGIPPRGGNLGDYWWLNGDGTPNTPRGDEIDIPF
jgi:hypothetical protein